jgi:molybdate transport system ATP-binding protein
VIRVLVVDDDAMVRTLLTSILTAQDLHVVGHATDGDEVVAAVQAHRPDVVLMDLHMARVPGLDAIAALGALPEPPGVIALTSWLLQGPNGSGKSTLLSLINGDHPQSYGLDISLFGKKRGSGESIWDIKQKIGMISPEMHWYFDQNATVWHTLASGFYDSIGWFIDVKFHEKKQIEELMSFFDLTEHKDQLLHTLPLGKQRLAMLARSIIKNPPLLVLDEPCQGLDTQQAKYFNDVVDELCEYGKTLIYVGHYESQLPSCIEKRIVLEKGEVVALENKVENVL